MVPAVKSVTKPLATSAEHADSPTLTRVSGAPVATRVGSYANWVASVKKMASLSSSTMNTNSASVVMYWLGSSLLTYASGNSLLSATST